MRYEPTTITVALHSPNEPANVRTSSFKINLGYETIVYITPRAKEIDESGRTLSIQERKCRLIEENNDLKVFKIYTQEACLLECKINMATSKCGCTPWNYLPMEVSIS